MSKLRVLSSKLSPVACSSHRNPTKKNPIIVHRCLTASFVACLREFRMTRNNTTNNRRHTLEPCTCKRHHHHRTVPPPQVGKWERRAYGVAPTGSQTASQVAAVKAKDWVEVKVAEDLAIKTNRYIGSFFSFSAWTEYLSNIFVCYSWSFFLAFRSTSQLLLTLLLLLLLFISVYMFLPLS